MTETMSYGSTTAAPPPVDEVEEAAGSDGRRRVLMIAAPLAALLLLVAGYLLFFSGGSSSDTQSFVAPKAHPRTGAVTQPGAQAPAPAAQVPAVPATFSGAVGRDPFQALIVPPPPPPPPAPVAPTTATTTATASGTSGTMVTLAKVDSASQVEMSVAGAPYTAKVGEVFATTYKVLTINGSCATFLNGDQQFALCQGQSVQQ
jgi:hypothetical protein